jgi:hypothetical protein
MSTITPHYGGQRGALGQVSRMERTDRWSGVGKRNRTDRTERSDGRLGRGSGLTASGELKLEGLVVWFEWGVRGQR